MNNIPISNSPSNNPEIILFKKEIKELESALLSNKISTEYPLEELREILFKATKLGLDEELKTEIATIRKFCTEIIEKNPPKEEFNLPRELVENILSYLPKSEIPAAEKLWHDVSVTNLILMINNERMAIRDIFENNMFSANTAEHQKIRKLFTSNIDVENPTVDQILNFFIENSFANLIEYADFSLLDFRNENLEKLVCEFKNIKHLIISHNGIKGNALELLKDLPELESLDISYCKNLAPNSLNCLTYLKNLKNLTISGHYNPEENTLDNLSHTKNLETLNLSHFSFSNNLLNCLKNTPNLKVFSLFQCNNLSPDSLKNLEYTPLLKEFSLFGCSGLDPNSLNYLSHTPQLKVFDIGSVFNFPNNALNILNTLINFETLNIGFGVNLSTDELNSSIKINR